MVNCRVLLVENDPGLLNLIQSVLRRLVEENAIVTAYDYLNAIQALHNCAPQIIILDSTLTTLNSANLVHYVLALPPLDATQIVLISEVPMRTAPAGLSRIADVLVKPIRPRVLEYILRRLLSSHPLQPVRLPVEAI